MKNRWLRSVGMNVVFVAIGGGTAFTANAQSLPVADAQPLPASDGQSRPASDAQSRPASEGQPSKDIIVTATRRNVALKDVDAALTVLSSDEVKTAGVKSLADVAPLVPNFQFGENFRAGVPYITMRGVATAQGGEAPVAVIVDGAQAPGLEFINQDLINIQDVEVLRGPQGALYGRGAIAGAVIINTQKPTNDLSGEIIGSYGSGKTTRVVGTLAGPIIRDRLWFRITAQERNSDGLIEDTGLHAKADDYRELVGRVEILVKPDDLTTVFLKAAYTTGRSGADVAVFGSQADIAALPQHPSRNVKDIEDRIIDTYSAKIDRTLSFATLTSISQYARSRSHLYGDGDFTPGPFVLQDARNNSSSFNQDLRLTSPDNQSFKWLLGAFYQKRNDSDIGHNLFDPTGPLCCGDFNNVEQIFSSTAYAAYGQANYDFGAGVNLSAALRYDVDRRFDVDRLSPGSATSHTFRSLQPLFTLSRKWTKDFMTYVSFGKGFRSGGFNAYPDTIRLGIPRLFPQETTKNYEAGFKGQWFDHKLSINASIFHTDFKNEQFFFINLEPLSRNIVTFPSTSLNGGELEISVTPVTGLDLAANLGITDAKIKIANDPKYNGNHSPNVNKYSVSLSAQYRLPLSDHLSALGRVDYNRRGRIYYDQTGLATFGPTDFVNARIGLETDAWSVAVIGKNLTNTRAPTVFLPNAAGDGIGGSLINKPRTFMLEASYKF
jgi:iron complex outermembrane receptor protein